MDFGGEDRLPSCECESWKRSLWLCKHFCAIFACKPEWTWESLSPIYKNHPYFNLDLVLHCMETASVCKDIPAPSTSTGQHEMEDVVSTNNDVSDLNNTDSQIISGRSSFASNCRDIIKRLLDLTYRDAPAEVFRQLYSSLTETHNSFVRHVKTDEGLVVEDLPLRRKKCRKRFVNQHVIL